MAYSRQFLFFKVCLSATRFPGSMSITTTSPPTEHMMIMAMTPTAIDDGCLSAAVKAGLWLPEHLADGPPMLTLCRNRICRNMNTMVYFIIASTKTMQ